LTGLRFCPPMQEERISVEPKEQRRALALNCLLAGEWTEGETAAALRLSIRQVRRLKRAYREEGIGSLIHGNRGRRPHHALPVENSIQAPVRSGRNST